MTQPNLKKGDVVSVLLHNGPMFVWTFLGLQKLGIIVSLINHNLKTGALVHSVRNSESKYLVFGSGKYRFNLVIMAMSPSI